MILSLANEMGLIPKRVSSTNGGEYHSPCPKCGGKDRFIIWNQLNRYYCRQCQIKGDAIQFCRDFMRMTYHAACTKLNLPTKTCQYTSHSVQTTFMPQIGKMPNAIWVTQANKFITASHQNLLNDRKAIQALSERGVTIETINHFYLGWNPITQFFSKQEWGLPTCFDDQGRLRRQWLPSGIVIPTIDEKIIKIKVRRNEWTKGDSLPKYVEISGSATKPSVYGNRNLKIILIIESELDAMLVQQLAQELCCCLALGGASKKPDQYTHFLLQDASLILFSLDFDEVGKKAFQFWKNTYPQLKAWPVPKEKGPGDAFRSGVDLKQWILDGLTYYKICNAD